MLGKKKKTTPGEKSRSGKRPGVGHNVLQTRTGSMGDLQASKKKQSTKTSGPVGGFTEVGHPGKSAEKKHSSGGGAGQKKAPKSWQAENPREGQKSPWGQARNDGKKKKTKTRVKTARRSPRPGGTSQRKLTRAEQRGGGSSHRGGGVLGRSRRVSRRPRLIERKTQSRRGDARKRGGVRSSNGR